MRMAVFAVNEVNRENFPFVKMKVCVRAHVGVFDKKYGQQIAYMVKPHHVMSYCRRDKYFTEKRLSLIMCARCRDDR